MDGGVHGVGEGGVDGDAVATGFHLTPLVPQLLLTTPLGTTVREPNLLEEIEYHRLPG